MNEHFPCICGHEKYLHVRGEATYKEYARRFLDKDTFCNFCLCAEFIGNNLKYIEDLTKESKEI
jgi:hypothetical protein